MAIFGWIIINVLALYPGLTLRDLVWVVFTTAKKGDGLRFCHTLSLSVSYIFLDFSRVLVDGDLRPGVYLAFQNKVEPMAFSYTSFYM